MASLARSTSTALSAAVWRRTSHYGPANVGGDAAAECPCCTATSHAWKVLVEDARVAARPQHLVQAAGRLGESADLVQGQRQELEQGGASRQGLGHGANQAEVLRPREQEGTRARPGVDDLLQVGQQVGHPLHFVDDGAIGCAGQEPARVGSSEFTFVRGFQRQVRLIRKGCPTEGGLARLSGAGSTAAPTPYGG